MGKALDGVRILDFTHVQSGPTCTQLLAWLGADVIKVERAGAGDVTREQLRDIPDVDSLYFTMLNHITRSITLDIKNPKGKEVLEALVNPNTVGKAWRDLAREGVLEARQGDAVARDAQRDEQQARNEKQPARAAQQEIAERAPAVPECFQVRRMGFSSVNRLISAQTPRPAMAIPTKISPSSPIGLVPAASSTFRPSQAPTAIGTAMVIPTWPRIAAFERAPPG